MHHYLTTEKKIGEALNSAEGNLINERNVWQRSKSRSKWSTQVKKISSTSEGKTVIHHHYPTIRSPPNYFYQLPVYYKLPLTVSLCQFFTCIFFFQYFSPPAGIAINSKNLMLYNNMNEYQFYFLKKKLAYNNCKILLGNY